jgi:hypothetical protein
MEESIHFKVAFWKFNSKMPIINPKTDCLFASHQLRKNLDDKTAHGLALIWLCDTVCNRDITVK